MGGTVAKAQCPSSHKDASASRSIGRLPPDEEAALLEEVRRRVDVGEKVPPLVQAVAAGDTGAVQQYLQEGDDPGKRDDEGRTPLHWAAGAGSERLLGTLLAAGADVEACDHSLQTPLHLAARAGRAGTVRVLVARGANVNAEDDEQRVPLHSALLFYHEAQEAAVLARHYPQKCDSEVGDPAEATRQVVERLLEGGDATGSVCHRDTWDMSPLTWALRLRLPAVARLLVDFYRPDYNRDRLGKTALHWAARAGDVYVVRRLLNFAFSPWKLDVQHNNSIMEAVESRDTETVRALLGGRKYRNCKNGAGNTALHMAVALRDAEMTQCLLDVGANAICTDVEGRMPLCRALELGEAGREVARVLLTVEAYHRQRGRIDKRGRTLVHAAAEGGDVVMLRRLLNLGAPYRGLDNDGETPLICAMRHGNRDAVGVLVDRRYLQLTADSHGRTPLHWAAAAGWHKEARWLLEVGCDPLQRDEYGRTAIVTAAECEHWDIANEMFDWTLPKEPSQLFKLA